MERLATMVHTHSDSLVRDAALCALASCALQGSTEGRFFEACACTQEQRVDRWQAAEELSRHLDTSFVISSGSFPFARLCPLIGKT